VKLTVKSAMVDFREQLVGIIFKEYPDHKKLWKAEEIENAISSAMYRLSIKYIEQMEREEK
jgi:hypothetical protein